MADQSKEQLEALAEAVAEILRRNKTDDVLEAQKKSIESMADYGQEAAGLLSKGDFNFGTWAKLYADTVKSVSQNVLELTRAILK